MTRVNSLIVNSFKSRLDKFWSMYDLVYDYYLSPSQICKVTEVLLHYTLKI